METILLSGANNEHEIKKVAYLLPLFENGQTPIPVDDFLTIGRAPTNSLCPQDPFVSQRHARIEKKGDRYLLSDLRSRNGTYLNGSAIVQGWLKPQDRIRIGEKNFLFTVHEENKKQPASRNYDWNNQLVKLPAFAQTDFNVLVIGPSGSGKELIAKQIHDQSARKTGPYITINCSALSDSLIESELFGHIKGAFTGATDDRKGAFESARGGTLFLDEVGDLPLSLQPKLLRALENKEIRPVGSDKIVSIDVRIISATHKNLYEKCLVREFREDLFHRLNVCRITPPSLIDRMEDFEGLLFSFAKEYRVSFSHDAIEKLKSHSWPGNIRELKNAVSRASAYFPQQQITAEQVEDIIDRPKHWESPYPRDSTTELSAIKSIERDLIIQKLQEHMGNQSRVAEDLGVPKSTLHDRLKAYGINPKIFKRRGRIL